jgi:hypothetical protein
VEGRPGTCGQAKKRRKSAGLLLLRQGEIKKNSRRRVSGHQDFLISELRRRGSFHNEGQLQVVDDAVDHGIVGEEGDNLHLALALRADHRVHFVDLADHLRPALGGDGSELVLHDQERKRGQIYLLDLPPVGIGIEPIVPDSDLGALSKALNFRSARRFIDMGDAFVWIQSPGSCQSGGPRHGEYPPNEVDAIGLALDWIVAQPWSNKRVGAFGGSWTWPRVIRPKKVRLTSKFRVKNETSTLYY